MRMVPNRLVELDKAKHEVSQVEKVRRLAQYIKDTANPESPPVHRFQYDSWVSELVEAAVLLRE